MASVYIREQGVMVTKQGECIAVVKGKNHLMERPVIGIDALALFGNVQISSQAITFLLERALTSVSFHTMGSIWGMYRQILQKIFFFACRSTICI